MYLEDWQRAEESALEAGYIDLIAEGGTEVNYLTTEQIAAFKASVQPLYDSYRQKLGDEIMDQVLSYAGK